MEGFPTCLESKKLTKPRDGLGKSMRKRIAKSDYQVSDSPSWMDSVRILERREWEDHLRSEGAGVDELGLGCVEYHL